MINDLLSLMDKLLSEDGCPWDREQTHKTLRKHMLEECDEAVEAIDNDDMTSLCEELGDVLLQIVFHAKLAEKAGVFTMDDVIEGIVNKLVGRHTHIFGNDKATTAEDVVKLWAANKKKSADKSHLAQIGSKMQ